jgi:hypothetical protein
LSLPTSSRLDSGMGAALRPHSALVGRVKFARGQARRQNHLRPGLRRGCIGRGLGSGAVADAARDSGHHRRRASTRHAALLGRVPFRIHARGRRRHPSQGGAVRATRRATRPSGRAGAGGGVLGRRTELTSVAPVRDEPLRREIGNERLAAGVPGPVAVKLRRGKAAVRRRRRRGRGRSRRRGYR